jgi:branched-chain amino acid transport system substrate-binding protein
MRLNRVIAVALLIAVWVVGAPGARAADPYDINVILPLTGNAAFLGKTEQEALQVVEKVVNGHGGVHGRPVRFNFRDDQSTPQLAVQLASQAVATKPAVIIGSALVGMCNAMAPLMENGPVMYCLSPGIHPKAGSYVYTSNVSTLDLASATIRYFRRKGWTRVAIITSTDASGQDALRGFREVLGRPENKDVSLVENVQFNPGDASVTAQIERIKAASPHAMIAWSTGAPVAIVFKAIIQAGLEIPVATTSGNMTYAQMTQYRDFLPKDLYMASSMWPAYGSQEFAPAVQAAQKEFFAAFKLANINPDNGASLAWDPAMVVIAALNKLPANASGAQLRSYLAGSKGFAGVNGVYDFTKIPQRGLDEEDCVMTRWDAAEKKWAVVSQPAGVPLKQ